MKMTGSFSSSVGCSTKFRIGFTLFSICIFLLQQMHPAASVALKAPSKLHDENDNSLLTNSVVPDDGKADEKGDSSADNCTSKNNITDSRGEFNRSTLIESIRQHILTKLNLQETPSNLLSSAPEIPASVLSSYYAKQSIVGHQPPQDCDKKTTHFARTVKVYYPDTCVTAKVKSELFVFGDENQKPDDADKEKSKTSGESEKVEGTTKDTIPPVLYTLTFGRLDFPRVSRLWSVVLKLFARKANIKSSGVSRASETVMVVRVIRTYNNGKMTKRHQLLATSNIRSEEDTYVSFDITQGIKKWLSNSSNQQDLELDVLIDTPEIVNTEPQLSFPPVITFDASSINKGENEAQLVVETLSDQENATTQLNGALQQRRRRQTISGVNSKYCFDNPGEANCCIRRSTIDFQRDLGWNWILLPHSFDPNYCSGQCQNPNWPSATLSTSYLMKLRKSNPSAAPEPCCVPHRTRSLEVVIILNNRIVTIDVPGMIVESCTCS